MNKMVLAGVLLTTLLIGSDHNKHKNHNHKNHHHIDPREIQFHQAQQFELLTNDLHLNRNEQSNPHQKIYKAFQQLRLCRQKKICTPLPETSPLNLHLNIELNPAKKGYYIKEIKKRFPQYLKYNRL